MIGLEIDLRRHSARKVRREYLSKVKSQVARCSRPVDAFKYALVTPILIQVVVGARSLMQLLVSWYVLTNGVYGKVPRPDAMKSSKLGT